MIQGQLSLSSFRRR